MVASWIMERKNMNKAISIFKQLRPITIGYDNVFDHFERMFDGDFTTPSFPFYNIVKSKDNHNVYTIEMALAGYGKQDIDVTYEDNVLTVKSIAKDEAQEDIIHKGIAKRYFSKSFTIAEDVNVNSASLENGLLKITLERIVPEAKAKRTIEIQ